MDGPVPADPLVRPGLDVDPDRLDEMTGGMGDLRDRLLERFAIASRRLAEAGELADVLAGGGLQFARRRRFTRATEGLDAAAHARNGTTCGPTAGMLGPMLEAFFWGFIGAAFLIVGAVIAFVTDLSPRWRGLILAFGAGALFGAVAYELIGDAIVHATSGLVVGIGFGAGALVFYLGSRAVEQMGDATEPSTGP